MAAPANELQVAIYGALISSTDLAALVGSRIYDRVPSADDQAPLVTIGDGQEVTDLEDCLSLSDHTVQVNVWSEYQGGFKEAKEIAFAVKRAIVRVDLSLSTHALIGIDHEDTRYLRDPDGITRRAIVTFSASVEEN